MYGAFTFFLFICMLASPMKEIGTNLKIGWKRTLVTGARWPLRQNFSGGLGIHSLGVLLSLVGAPDIYSFSASANFASSSLTCNPKVNRYSMCIQTQREHDLNYLFYSNMWHYKRLFTFFCNRITDVHFFSKSPTNFLSTSPGISVSLLNASKA